MPRVKYTAGKGLYQEAGSGLDITGTLEITGEIRGSKKELVQVTTTLTLADSGAVLIPTGAAKTFTLPAVATAAGFHVTFQAGSAAVHVINGGGSKIQGAIFHNTNGTTLARQAATNASSITLNGTNPGVGDYFTIVGDGTNYYVFGWCNAAVTLA
jgi:hypothetical protein